MSPEDQAKFETLIHRPFAYYRYEPSLAAAVIFTILFFLTTSAHAFQLLRHRTWYFIPLLIGGIRKRLLLCPLTSLVVAKVVNRSMSLVEIVGYIGRAIGSHETPYWTIGPFIQQSLCILLAPALFAASIYMILGRIILLVNGESQSPVRRTWLTKIFVAGDVLSFFTQSAGE